MVLTAYRSSAFAARRQALLDRLQQSITVEPVQRRADGSILRDAYGKALYGAPVQWPARVIGDVKMVRTVAGNEQVSDTTVIVPGALAITVNDRLSLPDGTRPAILSISSVPDDSGTLIQTIYT